MRYPESCKQAIVALLVLSGHELTPLNKMHESLKQQYTYTEIKEALVDLAAENLVWVLIYFVNGIAGYGLKHQMFMRRPLHRWRDGDSGDKLMRKIHEVVFEERLWYSVGPDSDVQN